MEVIITIASWGLLVTAFFGYSIILNCIIAFFKFLGWKRHKPIHKLPLSTVKTLIGSVVFILVAFVVLYPQSAFVTGEDWTFNLAIFIPNVVLCIFVVYSLLTLKEVEVEKEDNPK